LGINNAFLHNDLREDVYMQIPQGVQVEGNNKVCKLIKSLYGIKQASGKWCEKLSSLLISLGFH